MHKKTSKPVSGKRHLMALATATILGAGAATIGLTVSAASSSEATVLVPITPCRLVDTRPASQVGGFATPLSDSSAITIEGRGASGDCDLPTDGVALSLNVGAIRPTAQTFLTIWPDGVDRPTTSNLNPSTAVSVTANAVTVTLSETGRFNVFNNRGDVHLIVDVLGVFVPSSGAAGPEGPAGADGAPGAAGTDAPNKLRWFPDLDEDGYGNTQTEAGDVVFAVEGPDGWVPNGNDCDDLDPAVNPDADEINDSTIRLSGGTDENCDGRFLLFAYVDVDGDGYSVGPAVEVLSAPRTIDNAGVRSPAPDGYVFSPNGEDCKDTNPTVPVPDGC